MHLRIPVWLLCLVYAVQISGTECGEKKDFVNYEFRPTEEEIDCNITISHETGKYLMANFQEFDPDMATFTLKFPKNSVLKVKEEAVQPFRWIWTFGKNHRSVPFLKWRLDFTILSFGLLNAKALPEKYVVLEVQPPNCPITIGNRKSNLEIAYAFSNMTQTFLHSNDIKHDNWCYSAEIQGVKNTLQYRLGIHFGYPSDFIRYNCCYAYASFQDKVKVDCSRHQIETMTDTTSGPYILGLILFCYFPILLIGFGSIMSAKGQDNDNDFESVRNGYRSLGDQENNDKINYEDNLTSDFVYLEKHSPITLSSIIGEFCFQDKRHPRLASRLRRTLFIIICPILVYIQLIVYGCAMKETILELIKHGAPMNFVTMLAGFERSRELFVPLLGGPYVLISLFYVLGIVLVVLPNNLGKVLEDGSLDFAWADRYPLTLGYNSVKYFSHMHIEEESGYGRLRSFMIARFFCILNPAFWSHVCHMSLARFKGCMTYLRNRLPTLLYYILFLTFVPILFLTSFVELSLCFLYYGIPLPWFIFTTFTGLGNFWIRRHSERLDLNDTNLASCSKILACCFLLGLAFCYFSYSMSMIFCTGFNFAGEIIVFIFIAVLVYPTTAFGYLFFGTALLYYFLKQLRGIGDAYLDLLMDIAEVLMVLEAEPNQVTVVDGTLIVSNVQSGGIQKIQINECAITLSQEQQQTIIISATRVNDRLIRYKNKVPGIPRDLFLSVVKRHRPVFITVFKACLRIGIIMILMIETLRITSQTSHDSSHVTEVMHVIFIVLIGSLPRALEITFSDSNKAVLKEIFLKQLESTILEYNSKRLVETPSPNELDLETATTSF